MLLIQANLEASESHPRFVAGTKVPAVLLVAAADLEAAEEKAVAVLGKKGWRRMETKRLKDITDYAQFESREDVLADAFKDAQVSGFGYVLYPEPGT